MLSNSLQSTESGVGGPYLIINRETPDSKRAGTFHVGLIKDENHYNGHYQFLKFVDDDDGGANVAGNQSQGEEEREQSKVRNEAKAYLEAIKNLRLKEEESSKFRDQLERKLNEAYSNSKDIYMNNENISQVY